MRRPGVPRRRGDHPASLASGGVERVADRDGERVGLMTRPPARVERQDHAHHPPHLSLLGASEAAHRLLHARGRVLGALDPGGRGRDQRGAARLPDEERDAGVGTDEGLLERDGVRRVLRNERLHAVEDRPEASLRALARRRAPAAAREPPEAAAVVVDDAVPARSRPWVDAEDFHGRG